MAECTFCTCFLETLTNKQTEETDSANDNEVSSFNKCKHPLTNWEKWLEVRTNINNTLSKKLNRYPGELLMNAAEEYRYVREEKTLLENMKINIHFDKCRGNPAFWNLPPSIEEHCRTKCRNKCPCQDPAYFAVPTPAQKNEIPKMSYVGIANRILEEKNVLPRTRNIYEQWKKNPYRNAVMMKILKKLQHLEPHRPDTASMILLGGQTISNDIERITEVSSSPKDSICSKPRMVSDFTTVSHQHSEKQSDLDITFKINDIESISFIINGYKVIGSKLEQENMKVRIIFNVKHIPEVPLMKHIIFENKGKSALRICFRKFEAFKTFHDILPSERKDSAFYFDRRMCLLLPAKTIQFPIWFMPTDTGHYFEMWKITTLPKFWSDSANLIVILQGIVYEQDFEAKTEAIHKMLNSRVRSTLINDVLREIVDATKYQKHQTVKYTYSEKHYFEAINHEYWGTGRRPKYTYNKAIIRELQAFYKQITILEDPVEWNFSIKCLQELARRKDVIEYIENLYKKCEKGRKRATFLQELYSTPGITTQEIIKANQAAMMEQSNAEQVSNTNVTSETIETNYEKLNKIVDKLDRTVMIQNTNREKYATAYYILRFYFNQMWKQLSDDDVGCSFLQSVKPPTRIEDKPDRLIFEKFDDIWIQRKRRVPVIISGEFPIKPKPTRLEGIPLDQPEVIYSTYFHKPITPDMQKIKGKKNIEKTMKKVQKNTKKMKPNVEKVTKLADMIKEDFDPFADFSSSIYENLLVPPKQQPKRYSGSEFCSVETYIPKNYYEKYLIVYSNLSAGIDAMVAALETMKETTIPTQILSELVTCDIANTDLSYGLSEEAGEMYKNVNSSTKFVKRFDGGEESIRLEPDTQYFTYLLDRHFRYNRKTQDYFIKGKPCPIEKEKEEEPQPVSVESFHLYDRPKSQSVISLEYKSAEMQTSTVEDDSYEKFSNILRDDEIFELQSIQASEGTQDCFSVSDDDVVSEETFYYVDNGL